MTVPQAFLAPWHLSRSYQHTAHYILHTAHYILHTAHRTLHTALHTTPCTLQAAHFSCLLHMLGLQGPPVFLWRLPHCPHDGWTHPAPALGGRTESLHEVCEVWCVYEVWIELRWKKTAKLPTKKYIYISTEVCWLVLLAHCEPSGTNSGRSEMLSCKIFPRDFPRVIRKFDYPWTFCCFSDFTLKNLKRCGPELP